MPRAGMLFGLYLILYSISQFFIFFVRTEPYVAFGLKQAQLTAVITFMVGVGLTLYLSRHGPPLGSQRNAGTIPSSSAASAVDTG